MTSRRVGVAVVGLVASAWAFAACGTSGVPGHIPCSSRLYIDVGAGCTLGYQSCQDGHSYSVECANDVCACFTDSSSKKVEGLTDCPSDAEDLNEVCGFDVLDDS